MCRQYGETTDLLRSNMEPPAPVTSWLADFDLDKDEDTVDLLQDLKDNDEDLRHLHLMADIEMSSNDQYVLGRDRENHWLAYFLSKSTQLESLQLGWLTKGDVSLESGNYLIEAMNCLTTIKHFHFDLDSTMGLDSHEEMFDRLQPFFENNPIVTFELDRFGFYSDYYGDMSDQVDVEKEKKFIRGLKKAIKAAANVKCLRFSDDNCFSIHAVGHCLRNCWALNFLRHVPWKDSAHPKARVAVDLGSMPAHSFRSEPKVCVVDLFVVIAVIYVVFAA